MRNRLFRSGVTHTTRHFTIHLARRAATGGGGGYGSSQGYAGSSDRSTPIRQLHQSTPGYRPGHDQYDGPAQQQYRNQDYRSNVDGSYYPVNQYGGARGDERPGRSMMATREAREAREQPRSNRYEEGEGYGGMYEKPMPVPEAAHQQLHDRGRERDTSFATGDTRVLFRFIFQTW